MQSGMEPGGTGGGEPGSARGWRDVLDRVSEGLLDLISEHPEVADRVGPLVKQLARLRGQIEEAEALTLFRYSRSDLRGKVSAPQMLLDRWGLRHDRPVGAAPAERFAELWREPSAPKVYRIDDSNLKEFTSGPRGETMLQVSFEDYLRVASALTVLAGSKRVRTGRRRGVSARRLKSLTGRADVSEHIKKREVSLTHVYICLRFWQREQIIERAAHGQFMPADPDRPFADAATDAWDRLASETADGD